MTISREAAVFANATWRGPRASDGRFLWYGLNVGAPITDPVNMAGRTVIGADWLRLFVEKNSSFDPDAVTLRDYEWLFHRGVAKYDSIIGAGDPDLREFRRRNGKMITYYGTVSGWFLAQRRRS